MVYILYWFCYILFCCPYRLRISPVEQIAGSREKNYLNFTITIFFLP